MFEFTDQAAGLRRLLVGNHSQIFTLVSARKQAGRTAIAINLATALSQAGKDILLLDENLYTQNVFTQLGLPAQHDLLDACSGRSNLQQACLKYQGFSILSCARAMKKLGSFSANAHQQIEQQLTQATQNMDIMLVDATMLQEQAAISSSFANSSALIMIVDLSQQGLIEAYNLLKQITAHQQQQEVFILFNFASSTQSAQSAFKTLAEQAHNRLQLSLTYLGAIPKSEQLYQATQLRKSVIEAFPSAQASLAFKQLANRLIEQNKQKTGAQNSISQIMRQLMQQLRSKKTPHVVN